MKLTGDEKQFQRHMNAARNELDAMRNIIEDRRKRDKYLGDAPLIHAQFNDDWEYLAAQKEIDSLRSELASKTEYIKKLMKEKMKLIHSPSVDGHDPILDSVLNPKKPTK